VFVQERRDGKAAKRVTDKLRSYGVAHRELMPDVIHEMTKLLKRIRGSEARLPLPVENLNGY